MFFMLTDGTDLHRFVLNRFKSVPDCEIREALLHIYI